MRAISVPALVFCMAAAGMAHAQDAITEWNGLKAPPPPELKAVTLDPHQNPDPVVLFQSVAAAGYRDFAAVPA
jgi:hypothetical protein